MSYTKENIQTLKNSLIEDNIGVAYLRLDKENELMITTNKNYYKGAGVYLTHNPNGIGRTLFANSESYILSMDEVDKLLV